LNGRELLNQNAPQASMFWKWLGFSYKAIDIDGTPHSIPLDLNYDEVPFKEQGNYQIVTNYGTTEHVANQLNAFKIMHDLVSVDGLMIHNLPAQGMHNHGLVNYNPKFFWLLARSNGYQWLYFDYCNSTHYYALPQNIIDQAIKFSPTIVERIKSYQVTDSGLYIHILKFFKKNGL